MTPYPLSWPLGVPRRPSYSRGASAFTSKPTPSKASAEILTELKRWSVSADKVVISTNATLSSNSPTDPGAAVYFVRKDKSFSICCDRWQRLGCNLHAIAVVLEDLRRAERHGVLSADQMLSPFLALPAVGQAVQRRWHEILGVSENCAASELKPAYQLLAKIFHPDVLGGEVKDEWHAITQAYETAKQLKGVA